MDKYTFKVGDIIVSAVPEENVDDFSGFARILSVNREENTFSFDFYTKFGEVHWLSRCGKQYALDMFEDPEYYRLATLDEMVRFRDGLIRKNKQALWNDKYAKDTLAYLNEAIAESKSKKGTDDKMAGLTIPKDVTPETLNLIEDVLRYAEEKLLERKIKVSTSNEILDKKAERDTDNSGKFTYLSAVGTQEISRVFEDIRYQFQCEAEA